MKLGKYDPILLDFDGLLVDTEPLHFEAYRLMLKSFGYELPWTMTEYCTIAHTSSEFLKKMIQDSFPDLKSYNWEELYAAKKRAYLELIQNETIKLMPGAALFLQAIAHQPHAVVTHSPLEQIETIRSKIPELQSIPFWFTRKDYKNPKPAPDGYLHALKILKGDNPIGFEDSMRGFQSLQAANIPAVLVRPEYYPPVNTPSYKTLLDLLP